MSILVDFNQIFISNIMQQPNLHVYGVNEDLIRHMILKGIRSYRNKFTNDYGEIVICCDNKNFWRKSAYPYYKANRKKVRSESGADWNEIFGCMNKIKQEFRDSMPYVVMDIRGAEADDIIAVLCEHLTRTMTEPILILSGDKDFIQLHKYDGVKQYSPVGKDYVKHDDPVRFLREHIMRGDRSDGIPNFLSEDDTFVNGGRQTRLTSAKITEWGSLTPQDFCDYKMMRNYTRNQLMIDFEYIPNELKNNIINTYTNYESNGRGGILDYFMKTKQKELLSDISDF